MPPSPATTFLAPHDRLFLEEDDEAWTVGRLLSLAADVEREIPVDSAGPVAVRTRSAGFLVSACLALWRHGKHGVLLDPATPRDGPRQATPVLVSRNDVSGRAGDRPVTETGGDPLIPSFPSDADPLVEFLTSGSTGEPKLVLKKAYQFARQFERESEVLELPESPRVLCLAPSHHILGFLYGFYDAAAAGGRVAFCRSPAPESWLRRLRDLEPDLVVGVPTHYRVLSRLLDHPLRPAVYLCSGAPLPDDVRCGFQTCSGQSILQVYGSTESGGVATHTGEGPWLPLPGLRCRVGADGRLQIRSPWQDETGAWRATDDLAESVSGGFRLLGRADSVVKVGGERFSTEEIVRAARALAGIAEVVVVPYERYDEPAVALYVTVRRDATLTAEDVVAWLRGRLAPFKMPRETHVLAEMPMMGIGKIDTKKLREMVKQS